MAFEDQNEQGQVAQQPGTAYAGGQETSGAQQQPGNGFQGAGLVNLNSLMHRRGVMDGSDSRSGEFLASLTVAGEKAVANQLLGNDYELIRFDRDVNRVGLSSILVMKTLRTGGKVFLVVRPLLLSSNVVRLKPRFVQNGMQREELPTYPQHVFTADYWGRVVEFLKRTKGLPEALVVNAGTFEVPADFDITEKNFRAVQELLSRSYNRCDDVISRIKGDTPFNVAAVKEANEVLTARLDFTGHTRYDITGQPARSDIVVSMNRSIRNQQGQVIQSDEFYDADTLFNEVSMFVNLEYDPSQPQQQQPGFYQPQQATQLLTPAVVVTGVRQAPWILANTPELYFLALSNAYRVTAQTSWIQTFLPQLGKKEDPRDIGAISYLSQKAAKTSTKGDTFTAQDFTDLMTIFVRPQAAFMIDINPVGENSAVEAWLLEAAVPPGQLPQGERVLRATGLIVKHINFLTNNAFSQYFDHTKYPIVIQTGTDVHRGWYLDENNEKRDLRDLDTLAMLNATKGDLNTFMSWYRTMCDRSIPSDLRLKQREGFERLYLGNNLEIEGIDTRLMLHPAFVEALDKSTRDAGVAVDIENLSTVFGAQRFTGNAMVSQYVVANNAVAAGAVQGQTAAYTAQPGMSGLWYQ